MSQEYSYHFPDLQDTPQSSLCSPHLRAVWPKSSHSSISPFSQYRVDFCSIGGSFSSDIKIGACISHHFFIIYHWQGVIRGNHSGCFEGVLSLILSFVLSPENEVKHVLTLITLVSKHVFTLVEFKNQVAPTRAVKWVISKFLSTVCLPPAHTMPHQTEGQQAADALQRAFLVNIMNEHEEDLLDSNLASSSDNGM